LPESLVSFELRAGETLRHGIHRIAEKEMEKVREYANRSSRGSRDEMVHEVRKSLKKLRTILRLVRPGLSGKIYRRENRAFRDISRPLTDVRDATILVEALDKTAGKAGPGSRRRPFGNVRKELLRHQRDVRDKILTEEDTFKSVDSGMKDALDRLDEWTDVKDRWSSVEEGVQRVYRRSRRAFTAVTQTPTVEHLHEWRKQARYFRHQLELLRPLKPGVLGPLARKTDRLGELLGDDHDLAMLRREVAGDPERFGGTQTVTPLLGRIDQRREKLEHQAVALGREVFKPAPDDFVRRLHTYWKDWH
jgi:CHAD domain-containing protein